MKEEVKGDAELAEAFRSGETAADVAAGAGGLGARAALPRRAPRAVPAGVRLPRDLVARVRLSRPGRSAGSPIVEAGARLRRDRLRLPADARRRAGGPRRGRSRAHGRRPRGRRTRAAPGGARPLPRHEPAHAGPPLLHRPGDERPRPHRARGHRAQARRGRPAGRSRGRDVPALQRAPRLHGEPGRASTPARSSPNAATSASRRSPCGRPSGSARRRRPRSTSRTTRSGASRRSSTASRPSATDEVRGLAASPGVVEGTARLVASLDEFDQVQKGDVLVCQMTNPAWVVLFTKIAGLVTDAGGVVSHPAVVAREFGIPAVVGTSDATARIKTGDRVRVNGADRRRGDPGVTGGGPDAAHRPARAGQGRPARAHPRRRPTRRATGSSRRGSRRSSGRARRPCGRRCASSSSCASSSRSPSSARGCGRCSRGGARRDLSRAGGARGAGRAGGGGRLDGDVEELERRARGDAGGRRRRRPPRPGRARRRASTG